MQLSLISLALTKVYGGAAAFSPLSLFAFGEQGAWYDPSDLSTMFQNSAGTPPVTADGQPVGLILDKSKGLVLGVEQAVNGDFNSGTGWTLVGASISGGNLTFSSSALNDYASNSGGISAANVLFEITFTITSIASGSVRPQAGGRVGTARTSAGTYSERLVSVAIGALAIVAVSANTTAVVSDISLKVVTGNHATAPSDAARPLYKTDGTYHWLKFDGVDDSLSTAAIDFTSTDKMSMFAGVSVLNVSGMISDIGASSVGSTYLFYNTLSQFEIGRRGNGAEKTTFSSLHIAPTAKKTITACIDLANAIEVQAQKVNGANDGSVGTGDSGGGNFASSVLQLGSRGSALRLNGNIYSLIIRGALSTADEITATETWVNNKTGAY